MQSSGLWWILWSFNLGRGKSLKNEHINSGPLNCISMGVGLLPSFCPPPSLLLLLLSLFFHALFSKHKKNPHSVLLPGLSAKLHIKLWWGPENLLITSGSKPVQNLHPAISSLELSPASSQPWRSHFRRCLQPGDIYPNLKKLPHFASPFCPPKKLSQLTVFCEPSYQSCDDEQRALGLASQGQSSIWNGVSTIFF